MTHATAAVTPDILPKGAMPCPFVYATGKKCKGHIVQIKAFKTDLEWALDAKTGLWGFCAGAPRSHFHLYCSLKSNHAGWDRPDSDQLKFYFNQLPEPLQAMINAAMEHRPRNPATI